VICPRCSSEDLFQFEVSPTPAPPAAEDLPLVCRTCGAIMVAGEPVDLPEVLAKPIRELAENAKGWGKKAREELEELGKADPNARIEAYMGNFYRAAYMDGFFRALIFFRHHAREGRLRRIRELWAQGGVEYQPRDETIFILPTAAYTEIDQLVNLSVVPGESNAKSHAHKRPSGPKGRP
jgi:hypothetical protein